MSGKSKNYMPGAIVLFILLGLGGFLIFQEYHKPNYFPSSVAVQHLSNMHYSYLNQQDFFDTAYASAHSFPVPAGAVKAIMTNHHLLGARLIAQAMNTIATDRAVTVILISPNHFDIGKADVITSNEPWQTPYGVLLPDSAVAEKLAKNQAAAIEETPFEQEHGVSGIVPFIKKSLPNARIVPLIFKNHMSLAQAQTSADQLLKLLPADALIIGSFDFSHYLPSRAADFHDQESLTAISAFDFSSIYNLDMNSHPGLAFFLQLLKDYHDQTFTLLEHSNSSILVHQDLLETTSYLTGYFTAGTATANPNDTLLSLGTIIASPELVPLIQNRNNHYPLTYLEQLFRGQDITTAFLESSTSVAAGPINRTMQHLAVTVVPDKTTLYKLGAIKIQIVNCDGKDEVAVDQLASVVICQHAAINHIELRNNTLPVIYAAGNLLDAGVIKQTSASLAVGISYQNHNLKIILLPIASHNGQLQLLVATESDTVLGDMAQLSSVPNNIKEQINHGVITITK